MTNPELACDHRTDTLRTWLLSQGLEGTSQEDLIEGYCLKLVELGVPLMRVHVAQSAFHPQYGGAGYEWIRQSSVTLERYAHRATPLDVWLNSPLYQLMISRNNDFRERLCDSDDPSRYPILNELKAVGATDYYATAIVLSKHDSTQTIDPQNPPEGVMISWSSDVAGGFEDQDLDLIRSALPHLGLALKSASNRKVAHELLGVYLGRDAGQRVLSGEIMRGSLQQIDAVMCYFDLSDFTSLSEKTPGDDLISMLNDYFGVVVKTIQDNGGHILKFMGDGLLAMFNQADMSQATAAALDSAALVRRQMIEKNAQRTAEGRPVAWSTLALHTGEILYGNIGAENRLDFTVIGPAVNLTARLSGMHRSVDQSILLSAAVIRQARDSKHELVSLGRYMLRGVSEPQELFTIYDAG